MRPWQEVSDNNCFHPLQQWSRSQFVDVLAVRTLSPFVVCLAPTQSCLYGKSVSFVVMVFCVLGSSLSDETLLQYSNCDRARYSWGIWVRRYFRIGCQWFCSNAGSLCCPVSLNCWGISCFLGSLPWPRVKISVDLIRVGQLDVQVKCRPAGRRPTLGLIKKICMLENDVLRNRPKPCQH